MFYSVLCDVQHPHLNFSHLLQFQGSKPVECIYSHKLSFNSHITLKGRRPGLAGVATAWPREGETQEAMLTGYT